MCVPWAPATRQKCPLLLQPTQPPQLSDRAPLSWAYPRHLQVGVFDWDSKRVGWGGVSLGVGTNCVGVGAGVGECVGVGVNVAVAVAVRKSKWQRCGCG